MASALTVFVLACFVTCNVTSIQLHQSTAIPLQNFLTNYKNCIVFVLSEDSSSFSDSIALIPSPQVQPEKAPLPIQVPVVFYSKEVLLAYSWFNVTSMQSRGFNGSLQNCFTFIYFQSSPSCKTFSTVLDRVLYPDTVRNPSSPFVPKNFMIFTNIETISHCSITSSLPTVVQTRTPVLLVLIFKKSTVQGPLKQILGYFECSHCLKPLEYNRARPNQCSVTAPTDIENCIDTMYTSYFTHIANGRNLLWMSNARTTEEFFAIPWSKGVRGASPFSRHMPSSTTTAMLNLIAFDILHNASSQYIFKIDNQHAAIFFMETETVPEGYEFFFGSETHSYSIITAYNVSQTRTSFDTFFNPFSPMVWAVLVLLTIATGMITTGDGGADHHHWKNGAVTMAAIGTSLLEQGHRGFQKGVKRQSCTVSLLICGWLLLSVMLSNLYKSYMNSDFTIPYPLRTRVQGLLDLEHLSTAEVVAHANCARIASSEQSLNWEGNQGIMNSAFATRCRTQLRLCTFSVRLIQVLRAFKLAKSLKSKQRVVKACEAILEKIGYVCGDTINNFFVANKTSSTSTTTPLVFVVRNDKFEQIWQQFQNLMKTFPHLRFAHRRNIDGLPTGRKRISTRDGMHQQNSVLRRQLSWLFASGIYELWNWWEKRRFFSYNHTERKLKPRIPFRQILKGQKSMSLYETDLYLVFAVVGVGNMFSMLCFAFELMIQCYFRSCSKRKRYQKKETDDL